MQKLTKFKVIFDLFTVCVYFIQQQNCKLYYIYLMIISEIQSEIGHCSCDSAKFKAPADFSHHAILCMTLSLRAYTTLIKRYDQVWGASEVRDCKLLLVCAAINSPFQG